MTSASPAAPPLPTGWRMWYAGARPKTLPAALVPVLMGTAVAALEGDVKPFHAMLALVVSVSLQVGVNFANDYSDGIRGTDDTGLRVGPPRLVGWKLAAPQAVKKAALASFGVAAMFGLVLAAMTTWWLVLIGLVAIAAAWGYTGGPRPYGYAGLGEVFVFVFFGLVAVVGTVYVQIGWAPATGWLCGVVAGLMAMALLVVNNLRDIPGDTQVGKKTLAVRLGDKRTRWVYVACLVGAFVVSVVMAAIVGNPAPLLTLLGVPFAAKPVALVRQGTSGRALVDVLVRTGRVQLIVGVLLSAALALTGAIRDRNSPRDVSRTRVSVQRTLRTADVDRTSDNPCVRGGERTVSCLLRVH